MHRGGNLRGRMRTPRSGPLRCTFRAQNARRVKSDSCATIGAMETLLTRPGSRLSNRTIAARLLPGRFDWLMGLYAENHKRLARLFAPARLPAGEYASSVGDGLDVRLSIQARHPYTVEIGLSYAMLDAGTGNPAPSAQLRSYLDARMTEALHCEPGRDLWQVLGPFTPARNVMQHRLRMNAFLNRWLEYLAEQGHSLATLERHQGEACAALQVQESVVR